MSDRVRPRKPSDERGPLSALGRAIMSERTARGLSRQDLAEAAGLSYPYLSEIENGSKRASSRALVQIAEALGLTPSELFSTAERLPPDVRTAGAMPMAAMAAPMVSPERAVGERTSWFRSEREPAERDRSRLEAEIARLVHRLETHDLETILRLMRKLAR